ncbi:MAG: HAD family hydrolase [Nitrospira sp.]|nr:HAD family hydrolase [Nitrospira sp.]
MRLVLFDIDGTLIDSGGAGVRSLDLALKDLFSIENGFHGISMAGKTDTQIIKEGIIKHGLSASGTIDAVIKAYLNYLRREINNDRKHVKPGIYEALKELKPLQNLGLGLLTGNIEQGARIKLEPFRLNEYFPAGAFGSDDEDRNNLLPIALKRFEELFQQKIEPDNCIIVGDTPRDVECAHIYGAMCIAVATGPYSYNDLIEAGADYVVQDLSDRNALLQFF